jgi:mRNA interferase MazF
MVAKRSPRRGEVWTVELDPTVGREIQKTRPCLVVSPDVMNRHLDTYTIMPMTSGSRQEPFRLPVIFEGKNGLLLCDQLRTADYRRMRKKVGEVDVGVLADALAVLREMFEEE